MRSSAEVLDKMVNDCCPKIAHDERRARQRHARYLKRLTQGGLSYIDGYGVYDPTPPEAVKLIKMEIKLLKAENDSEPQLGAELKNRGAS